MANKFRGITWNNARFGAKIIVRRSIDVAELGDFGNITDSSSDLPTSGALHRTWTDSAMSPVHGSKSGTREYTDLRYVDSNVVDTQDMGLISDVASTHRVWSSMGAITDVVTSAPTTLDNPSSSSSSSSSSTSGYTLANSSYDGLATTTNRWYSSGSFSNLTFANDGMTALMTFYGSSFNGVRQYNLSTAYDLTTASLHPNNNTVYEPDAFMSAGYAAMSHNNTGQYLYDAKFNNDGTRLFVADQNDIYRYDLSTAYDISTASYTGDVFRAENILNSSSASSEQVIHSLSYGQTQGVSFFDIHFSTDGTKLISFNHEDRMLMAWDLATAWDVTTAIDTVGDRTIVNLDNDQYKINDKPHAGLKRIEFNSDGTKMYLGSTQQVLTDGTRVEAIVEFDLSTAWDISTLSLSGNVMDLTTLLPTVQDGGDTNSVNQNVMSFTYANGKFFINNGRTLTDGTNISKNFQIISLGGGISYTYSIALTDSNGTPVTSVDEGSVYTLTVATDAPDGSVVWFTAQEDIEAGYTDPVTIDWLMDGTQSIARTGTVTNGVATTALAIIADQTTETGYEKFRFVVSSSDDGVQWTGDGAGVTPWITINDTSQDSAPAATAADYSWTVTTSIDAPNPVTYSPLASGAANYGVSSDYTNSNIHPQFVEGTSMTWTATTDAPDGIQVYYTFVGTYMGSYDSAGDPNWGDVTGVPGTSGYLTVSNGQVSGTFNAVDDGEAEDGEMKQIWLMKQSGDYSNVLAESQWVHIVDADQATWTAPTAGETFTGGEGYTDPVTGDSAGTPQGEVETSADSTTGNPRVRIRVNENVDSDLRRNISYVLDNLSAGDQFFIDNTSMQVTGNITKTYLGSPGYYDYYFDVSVEPSFSGYFYRFTVVA